MKYKSQRVQFAGITLSLSEDGDVTCTVDPVTYLKSVEEYMKSNHGMLTMLGLAKIEID